MSNTCSSPDVSSSVRGLLASTLAKSLQHGQHLWQSHSKSAGMLTGKYEVGRALPAGPRALLFRQILPGLEPLLAELRAVADARGKTPSQVSAVCGHHPRSVHLM